MGGGPHERSELIVLKKKTSGANDARKKTKTSAHHDDVCGESVTVSVLDTTRGCSLCAPALNASVLLSAVCFFPLIIGARCCCFSLSPSVCGVGNSGMDQYFCCCFELLLSRLCVESVFRSQHTVTFSQ